MSQQSDYEMWLKYPTGKIKKGSFCNKCARYNSRPTAVSCILLNDKKVLLVKRKEEPAMGEWDIPGGYLDWDETLQEAAIRELKEETNLVVKKIDLKFYDFFSDPNSVVGNQVIEFYFISNIFSGELKIQESEVVKASWFELNKLPEKIAFSHRQFLEKLIKE